MWSRLGKIFDFLIDIWFCFPSRLAAKDSPLNHALIHTALSVSVIARRHLFNYVFLAVGEPTVKWFVEPRRVDLAGCCGRSSIKQGVCLLYVLISSCFVTGPCRVHFSFYMWLFSCISYCTAPWARRFSRGIALYIKVIIIIIIILYDIIFFNQCWNCC